MEIIPFLFFCGGLIMGSFLNVVLFRTETDETLLGRSHCRSCKNTIAWYDNLPVVSFIFLSGKCRQCAEKISWRYPLVELGTGVLFLLAGLFAFRPENPVAFLNALWWCFLFSALLLIALYDLDHMEIPVSFLLWGIGGSFVFLFVINALERLQEGGSVLTGSLATALLGGLIAAAFFYLLVWMSHERWMGMGDVWLGLLAGLAVGPRAILFLLTMAFTLGALVAIFLLAEHKKELSAQVPFAPFLCLATVIVMVLLSHAPSWLELFLFPVF